MPQQEKLLQNILDELKMFNQNQMVMEQRVDELKDTTERGTGLKGPKAADEKERDKRMFNAFSGIQKGLSGIGGQLKKTLSGLASGVGGVFGTILEAAKIVGLAITGALGLQGFLAGWNRAEKWFGENADFWDKLSSGLAGIAAFFLGLDENTTKDLAMKIDGGLERIGEAISGNIDGIKKAFKGLFEGDASTFISGMRDAVQSSTDLLFDGLKGIAGKIFGEEGGKTVEKFQSAFNKFLDTGESLGKFAVDIGGVFTGSTSLEDLKKSGAKVLEDGKAYVSEVAGLYKDFFSGVGTGLENAGKIGKEFYDTDLKPALDEAWGGIKSTASGVLDGIAAGFDTYIAMPIKTAWENTKTTVSEAFTNNITNPIKTTFENIKTTITEKVEGLKTGVSDFFSTLKGAIPEIKIPEGIQSAADSVKMLYESIADTLSWDNLKTEASKGINLLTNTIYNMFVGFTNSIINGLNSAIGILNSIGTIKNPFTGSEYKLIDLPYIDNLAKSQVSGGAPVNQTGQFANTQAESDALRLHRDIEAGAARQQMNAIVSQNITNNNQSTAITTSNPKVNKTHSSAPAVSSFGPAA